MRFVPSVHLPCESSSDREAGLMRKKSALLRSDQVPPDDVLREVCEKETLPQMCSRERPHRGIGP